MPAIPVIPPVVHSATYRVNSVEHFQQVFTQVSAYNMMLFGEIDGATLEGAGSKH